MNKYFNGYVMREIIVNQIKKHIKTLNSVHIVNNHDCVWKKEQLIFKFETMLEFLNENEYNKIDLRKFYAVYNEVQNEMDKVALKWL
jgi:hypothetical protein